MLIKAFPARYAKYVEAEVKSALYVVDVDASERTQPAHTTPDVRLVPSEQYDACELGETIVILATPNDPPPDVIRRVTEALATARRVRVETPEAAA